jgi:hypothetical protein
MTPFSTPFRRQEVVVDAGDHVDDGVADGDDVEPAVGCITHAVFSS